MTAAPKSAAAKTSYVGGWRDKSLRTGAMPPGTPLEPPPGLSDVWASVQPAQLLTLEIHGETLTGALTSRATFFEVCPGCRVGTGRWFTNTPGDGFSRWYDQDRHYNFGRCRCVPVGASLRDIDAVPIASLGLTPMVLSGLRRAGIIDTHDLSRYGRDDITQLPGIGPTTVMKLAEAVAAAGLPDWR